MAEPITSVPVASEHLNQWNAEFYEYDYVAPVGSPTAVREYGLDLETLTIRVANRRAVVIEDQIMPMSVRMEQRNEELDNLSAALGDMAGFSALFVPETEDETEETKSKDDDDDEGEGKVPTSVGSEITAKGHEGLLLIGVNRGPGYVILTKSEVDSWTQKLQGATNTRNNEAQRDMTRIQSLVNRRDDSYELSSSLSEKIAGTRSNAIKNM